MKHLKFFEDFEDLNFVGYHCNDSNDRMSYDDFIGDIKTEYYDRFSSVLVTLSDDYPEVRDFVVRIDSGEEEFYYETELAWEIEEWFEKNNIQWIFVADEPNNNYGNNCYKVYFKYDRHLYYMDDTAELNATVYIYVKGKNNPILK